MKGQTVNPENPHHFQRFGARKGTGVYAAIKLAGKMNAITRGILIREIRRRVPESGKPLGRRPNGCLALSDAAHAIQELNTAMIPAKAFLR